MTFGFKMKIHCSEWLSQIVKEPKEKERRLLPEEYGYLVEWPRKEKPKKARTFPPLMTKSYDLKHDPAYDRIPF